MIKSLLDADENPPPGTKVIIEETIVNPPPVANESAPVPVERLAETENILEIPELNVEPENASEIYDAANKAPNFQPPAETISEQAKPEQTKFESDGLLFQSSDSQQNAGFVPESQAETIRKSGLAYAAAITLFGSIVFLLIIGWFADTLLGTSPWGKVGGVVLGSIIGFLQFFRMTSQILKNKD
jgi:F0F1-type ATP synthase assembly protein I